MKVLRRTLLPLLVGVLAFGSLLQLPIQAQTSFPTAALQALKQTLTSAGYFGLPRYTTAALPACTAANLGAVAYDTTLNGTYYCNGTVWGGFAGAVPGSVNTFSAVQIFSSDQGISLGGNTTAFPLIQWNTTETVDTGMLLTGTTSNHWVIAERQDNAFDFAHAATTDPTLFIHSHNQSTTQWLGLSHDGTNGFITLGTGALQLGPNVNGAAVAQTIKGADGITGSDNRGGSLTLSSGVGTGNGSGTFTGLGRTLQLTTGTSQQSRTQGFTVCESKNLSVTTGTPTALANITLASNAAGASQVTVAVQCTDGTNFDSDVVTSYVAYVNKATVVTIGTAVTTASAAANNSGSCTVVPTFVQNGNSIDIKVTPAFSTIAPTSVTSFVNVQNLGPGTVTCN